MITNGRKDAEFICQSIMRTLKCNRAVAVGICANICYESGFRSAVEEDVSGYAQSYLDRVGVVFNGKYMIGGKGLFQHTGTRRVNLYQYCQDYGYPVDEAESQIAFMIHEIESHYHWFIDENCGLPDNEDTAASVAYDFAKYIEVPADTEGQARKRATTARQFYSRGWDA